MDTFIQTDSDYRECYSSSTPGLSASLGLTVMIGPGLNPETGFYYIKACAAHYSLNWQTGVLPWTTYHARTKTNQNQTCIQPNMLVLAITHMTYIHVHNLTWHPARYSKSKNRSRKRKVQGVLLCGLIAQWLWLCVCVSQDICTGELCDTCAVSVRHGVLEWAPVT